MNSNDMCLKAFNLIIAGLRCLRAMQMLDWYSEKDEESVKFSVLIDEYLTEGGDTRSRTCKTICSYGVGPAR